MEGVTRRREYRFGESVVRHYARDRISGLLRMYGYFITSGQSGRAFDQRSEISALIQIIRWLEGTEPRRFR